MKRIHIQYLVSGLLYCSSVIIAAGQTSETIVEYDQWGRANPDAFYWTGVSVGPNVGTLGLGGEAAFYITDWLNLRANGHSASFLYKTTIDSINYDFDLSAPGMLFLVDLYPGRKGNFRFVAGVALRDAEVSISGTPRDSEELGRVGGKASYDTVAPYFGIGFGNTVLPDSLLTLTVDFGVLIQDYSLQLGGEGVASDDAVLEEVRSDVEDRLDWLKIYPVVTIGLSYHF